MGKQSFTDSERRQLMAWFAGRPVARFWFTDLGDALRISGFVANSATKDLRLVSNGSPLPGAYWHTVEGLVDPDNDPDPSMFRVFRWWPGLNTLGFGIDLPYASIRQLSGGNDQLRIDIVDAQGQRAVAQTVSLSLPVADFEPDAVALPTPKLMTRVMGNASTAEWVFSGSTNMHLLDLALRSATGSPLSEVGRLLEWGSGCGRLSRHLVRLGIDFTGIDIDAEAVAWCNQNLLPKAAGRARFVTCSLQPPTGFEEGTFDAAVGISVMTHLDRPSEQAWLGELARVIRPGGVLAITTHGLDTYSQMHEPSIFRELMSKGSLNLASSTLDNLLGVGNKYYRESWHSDAWIREHWTEHFQLHDIWRGAHCGFQDLVILRKR